jgi:hypothetical protein
LSGEPPIAAAADEPAGGPAGRTFRASADAAATPHLPAAEEQFCANHPGRSTMVSCSSCGKPLCPDCMIFAPVGIKCRECARTPRSARVTLKSGRLLQAVGAGLGAGTAVGFAYYFILGRIGFFFLFFFVAAGIGYLVGEAVLRAGGHYHGVQTAVVAALATLWAFLFPPVLASFLSFGVSWNVVVFAVSSRGVINWVIMAIAAYLAWHRNR